MPDGLLREWLWSVLEREGVWVYCCALVWICMGGMAFDAEYVEEVAGLPPAGWSAPGTLARPALEGTTLEEAESEPWGVACWTLNAGAAEKGGSAYGCWWWGV